MATNTSTVLICFLACLLLVKGQVGQSKARCQCLDGVVKHNIRSVLIKKMEVFSISNSCPQVEIVVTLRNGAGRKCLDPKAHLAKKMIDKWLEIQKGVLDGRKPYEITALKAI